MIDGDYSSAALREAFHEEPRLPLTLYSQLAERAINAGDEGTVLEISKDVAVQDALRGAAITALPSLDRVAEAVLELLSAADPWARVIVLTKLGEVPLSSAVPRLLDTLNDPLEVTDLWSTHRASYLAAVALARTPNLPGSARHVLDTWLSARRHLIHASDSEERRLATVLFASLGDPEALSLLHDRAVNEDDVFDQYKDALRRIEQREG